LKSKASRLLYEEGYFAADGEEARERRKRSTAVASTSTSTRRSLRTSGLSEASSYGANANANSNANINANANAAAVDAKKGGGKIRGKNNNKKKKKGGTAAAGVAAGGGGGARTAGDVRGELKNKNNNRDDNRKRERGVVDRNSTIGASVSVSVPVPVVNRNRNGLSGSEREKEREKEKDRERGDWDGGAISSIINGVVTTATNILAGSSRSANSAVTEKSVSGTVVKPSINYGVIVELPADITHPLVDQTNSRLYSKCASGWTGTGAVEGPTSTPMNINGSTTSRTSNGGSNSNGNSDGVSGSGKSSGRSSRGKKMSVPTWAVDACYQVRKEKFFEPSERTLAVHMWTHTYLGWSFIRGMLNNAIYDEVEKKLPPSLRCPA
jgi:hypothetical protein